MNRITDKDFSFKCPMSWDDMEDSASGKFCSKCRKEVFDLTNCSTDEIHALQTKHGSICGSIRVAQAAVVAFSLSAAACQKAVPTTGTPRLIAPPINNAQSATATEGKKRSDNKPENEARLLGEVCPPSTETPKVDTPAQEADPFVPDQNAPMILGKICPQPIPNQKVAPSDTRIDI